MATKKAAKKSTKKTAKKTVNKWSASVTSDSTHPEPGLFNEDAQTIAGRLAAREVSPRGPTQGMQMLNFYINRAGKNMPEKRHQVLEHAKNLLSKIIAEEKEKSPPKQSAIC